MKLIDQLNQGTIHYTATKISKVKFYQINF